MPKVRVQNPDGQTGSIDASELPDALNSGWKVYQEPQQSMASRNAALMRQNALYEANPPEDRMSQPNFLQRAGNAILGDVGRLGNMLGQGQPQKPSDITNPEYYPGFGAIQAGAYFAGPDKLSHKAANAVMANPEGIEEASQKGDYGALIGHGVVPIGAALLGGRLLRGSEIPGGGLSDTPIAPKNPFPTQAQAAAKISAGRSGFEQVITNGGSTATGDIQNVLPVVQRALELRNAGGSPLPAPIARFLERVTDPAKGPPTYQELRDYYMNSGRLSIVKEQSLDPVMRGQLNKFRSEVGKSAENIADDIGQGDAHRQAMKDYAQGKAMQQKAANLREAMKKSAGVAGKSALMGAGLAAGYKIAHPFFEK